MARGLSGPLVAILGSGITILEVLKEASEAIGAVPFLKPIFASVSALLSSAQVFIEHSPIMRNAIQTSTDFCLSKLNSIITKWSLSLPRLETSR